MSAKLAIAIDVNQLRDLMREFTAEVDPDNKHLLQWTFETFLQWLLRRQETTNEQTSTPGITSTQVN